MLAKQEYLSAKPQNLCESQAQLHESVISLFLQKDGSSQGSQPGTHSDMENCLKSPCVMVLVYPHSNMQTHLNLISSSGRKDLGNCKVHKNVTYS